MRLAVVSDIHGNVPALRAVLADIERAAPDAVVSCGDVAAGPLPGETIGLLRDFKLPIHYVRGNADRGMVEAFDGLADPATTHEDDIWAASQLTHAQRDFLAAFAPTLSIDVDGLGPVLFCHGTPRSDGEIVLETSSDERLTTVLAAVEERTVVCGNTHMQFDRSVGRWRLINAGSVGWPYGRPGAHWVLLGPGVSFRRTGYDAAAAAEEIRKNSRWPNADTFVREAVLHAMPAADALAFFQQRERDVGTEAPPA